MPTLEDKFDRLSLSYIGGLAIGTGIYFLSNQYGPDLMDSVFFGGKETFNLYQGLAITGKIGLSSFFAYYSGFFLCKYLRKMQYEKIKKQRE